MPPVRPPARKPARRIPALTGPLLVAGLFGCSTASGPGAGTPPAAETTTSVVGHADGGNLDAAYADLRGAGGRVFKIDPAASAVRIYAFRAGKASRLGHNHVLSAPKFVGYFHLPATGTSSARFDLEFRLDDLEIDDPALRAAAGPAFATATSPSSIEATREHMLGADGLQAARYPFVRIHSLQIVGEAPRFAAHVRVEMHGRVRDLWLPLRAEGLPDSLAVEGSLVLRQTDFDAQPYQVLGGMLAVEDEVVVEFRLVGA